MPHSILISSLPLLWFLIIFGFGKQFDVVHVHKEVDFFLSSFEVCIHLYISNVTQ